MNEGGLPPNYFALAEQPIRGPIPDVLTLKLTPGQDEGGYGTMGLAVATAPPRTRHVRQTDADPFLNKANRIAVHHRHGNVIAVIEIVSPGKKGSRAEIRAFAEKAADLIVQGVHLLVIDLLPPGPRDPQGIHKVIWDEFLEEPFELPPDKPLTLADYSAGIIKTAYVEPVGVGDRLPDMPLFLQPEVYVPVPLEATYQASWKAFPNALKGLLESPTPPPSTGQNGPGGQ